MVGRSTEQAPITVEGVVLSHPVSNTIPSSGLARILLGLTRYYIYQLRGGHQTYDLGALGFATSYDEQTPSYQHGQTIRYYGVYFLSYRL